MAEERVGWVGDHNNAAIGRLKPGVSPEQAQAELDVLQTQVGARASQEAHEPVTLGSVVVPLAETVVGQARRGLLLLLASIAAVLLIACSNLTNLSLTRTMARQRDKAIRSALGASRLRVVAQALLEQLTLSTAGGAAGVGIAWIALAVFVKTAPIDLPRANEVSLDGRVLLFVSVVSIACGLLIACLPAWRTSRGLVEGALRASVAASTSDRSATRTRSSLLALQVGLSVTLLVVTALLSLSFERLVRVDRGFSAEGVLAAGMALPTSRYAQERVRLAAYDRVLAAIQTLPGVESATTTSILPLRGEGQINSLAAGGDKRPRSERPTANFRFVAPGFFRTIGVPVLRGRTFLDNERDPSRPAPSVVSERTAAVPWPGGNPLGQRFSRGEADEQGFEVVGVAADASTTSIERTPPLMVYAPYWWRSRATTSLLIKSRADPALLMAGVRRAVREVDPEIAIGQPRTLQALVDASFAARRYQIQLFAAFGAVALLIATLGVYAVTAYGVSRRRREMNIRVALGAQPSQVLRLVVGQSSRPVLVGVGAGIVGALGMGGVVASLLFEVRARDPLVLAGVAALVGGVGLATSLVTARQGLSLNPAVVLRDE
jgi:predicted permease